MPKLYCKIFGERHSGTKFLSQAIRSNFTVRELLGDHGPLFLIAPVLSADLTCEEQQAAKDALYDLEAERFLTSDFGWKHGAPPVEIIERSVYAPHTLFITIFKHPLFWLKGLHQRSYHTYPVAGDFSAFLRQPWKMSTRDRLPGHVALAPIDFWVRKTQACRKLADSLGIDTLVFRYEDLLSDYPGQLERMRPFLLRRREGQFKPVDLDTDGSGMSFAGYQVKYALDKAEEGYSQEDLDFVRSRIPGDLLDWLGYQL